jgi:hypothetical protein
VKKYLKQVLIEIQRDKNVTGGRQKGETLKEVYRVYNKIKNDDTCFCIGSCKAVVYLFFVYIYIKTKSRHSDFPYTKFLELP